MSQQKQAAQTEVAEWLRDRAICKRIYPDRPFHRNHQFPVLVPVKPRPEFIEGGLAPLTPDFKGTMLCNLDLSVCGPDWDIYEVLIPLDAVGFHLSISINPHAQPALTMSVVEATAEELRVQFQADFQGWTVMTGSDGEPMNHLDLVTYQDMVVAVGWEREPDEEDWTEEPPIPSGKETLANLTVWFDGSVRLVVFTHSDLDDWHFGVMTRAEMEAKRHKWSAYRIGDVVGASEVTHYEAG